MMAKKSRIVLSYNVAELRRRRGLTQTELASLADMSQRFLCSIERGCSNVSLEYVDSLAGALQVTAAELLDGSKIPQVTYEHMLLVDERNQARKDAVRPRRHGRGRLGEQSS